MEYKVENTELTLIANAIRSACNLSDELEFPSDFIAKINTLNSAYVGEDESPYLLRQSPTDFGSNYNSKMPTLIGGTIAWNQLAPEAWSNVTDDPWFGYFYSNRSDGTGSYDATAKKASISATVANSAVRLCFRSMNIKNHIYIVTGIAKSSISGDMRIECSRGWTSKTISVTADNDTEFTWMFKPTSDTDAYTRIQFAIANNSSAYTLEITKAQTYDLTAAFGTEIADYIYSLEQSTAGSGIAWLKSYGFLTKDYYAYDAGSLVSVKTSEHRTTGKNLLPNLNGDSVTINGLTFTKNSDGSVTVNGTNTNSGTTSYWVGVSETGLNLTFPEGEYILTGSPSGGGSVSNLNWFMSLYHHGNGANNWGTFDFGNGATYPLTHGNNTGIGCRIGIGGGKTVNNITFYPMLRRVGTDATYEPYESHSYPLDSDLELRGIPKLSNGSLYYDGDEYRADGTVTRKYGIVDLGTLDWSWSSAASAMQVTLPIKLGAAGTKIDALVSQYYIVGNYGYNGTYADLDKILWVHATNGALLIKDSAYVGSSSISDFTSAMSGVYLVYPLATPTTETADSFASPQIVSPLGTEEYVDIRDVPVPVGHRTEYDYRREVI